MHVLRWVAAFGFGIGASACFSSTSPRSKNGDGGAATAVVTFSADGGVPISPFAFGQNYWDWADWSHDGITGLTGTEPLVAAMHLNVLRAGGNNNDANNPLFDTTEIDKFVAYCRAIGAEPILQVPLVANNVDGGAATAETAADMVTYANVTKGYGIRYWEVGNEPDLYARTQPAGFPVRTATEYCAQFEAYVTAMKAANGAAGDGGAPMQFLGPELAQPDLAWLVPFLDGCKNDVDIVTVHRYPFGGPSTSMNGAISDATAFTTAIGQVAAAVQAHARPNTPFGITESNISYDYQASVYTAASIQAAPGTYSAALWTADAMGVALQNGLWTFALWNLGDRSRADSVLGFIAGNEPTPAYYIEQMVASNFRGQMLVAAGVPAGFSVYASEDTGAGTMAILVLNKTSAATSLSFLVGAQTGRTFDFPPLSVTLVQLADAADGAARVTQYTADLAAAHMAPQSVP